MHTLCEIARVLVSVNTMEPNIYSKTVKPYMYLINDCHQVRRKDRPKVKQNLPHRNWGEIKLIGTLSLFPQRSYFQCVSLSSWILSRREPYWNEIYCRHNS